MTGNKTVPGFTHRDIQSRRETVPMNLDAAGVFTRAAGGRGPAGGLPSCFFWLKAQNAP